MSKEKAIAWWNYANFGRVIRFVESIYPRIPTTKDKINFWIQEGKPKIKNQ